MQIFLKFQILVFLIIYTSQTEHEAVVHAVKQMTNIQTNIFLDKYKDVYHVDAERVDSTTPDSDLHCKSVGRKLNFINEVEIFRPLDNKNISTENSVYFNLVNLITEQEIIQFQIVKDNFYVITSNNKIYFLKGHQSGKPTISQTSKFADSVLEDVQTRNFFTLIIDYAPMFIFSSSAYICHQGKCQEIEGWEKIDHMTHATFTKIGSKKYIIITENDLGFSIYELTNSNRLVNRTIYNNKHFKQFNLSIFDVNVNGIDRNQIYILDYLSGLYSFQFQGDDLLSLKEPKLIVDQKGCYAMDVKNYEYMVLNCRLQKTNFLLQVYYIKALNQYNYHKPYYKYQTILDVQLNEKYYVTRGFSGFKFYWRSKDKIEYPQEYRKGGEIFIQNIQSKFKTQNGVNYLYYATRTHIKRIEIQEVLPQVSCKSDIATTETYKIIIKYACDEYQQILCTQSETIKLQIWQQSEINILRNLIPTILSFFGAILIIVIIAIVYKREKRKEQEASIRFATTQNQFGMASNR